LKGATKLSSMTGLLHSFTRPVLLKFTRYVSETLLTAILTSTIPLQLFLRISPHLPTTFLPAYDPPSSTPLTQVTPHVLPTLRPDRPVVLVSSTSWTEDEDFSILLDALSLYEHRARVARGTLPRILMFVTGKGPLREAYMRKARILQDGEEGDVWQWVRIISTWLEPKDYPLLLGMLSLPSTSLGDVSELSGLWAQGQQTWAYPCIQVHQH
jgi:hypothetical protein